MRFLCLFMADLFLSGTAPYGSIFIFGSTIMITSVATWRCKCGVTIKVVTETDRARSEEHARVAVSCPKCGDEQSLYAHRIVSITTETRMAPD